MQQDIETKQLRSFGLIVGGIFAVISLWPSLIRGQEVRLWTLVVAVLLIVPALVLPRSLKLFYRLWMTLGQVLGWINTRIILGVIFYGLFTPMGLVMRLLGKDPMRRRFEADVDSYRLVCQPRPSSHMTRQF
jgi:hypothetical protein